MTDEVDRIIWMYGLIEKAPPLIRMPLLLAAHTYLYLSEFALIKHARKLGVNLKGW